MRTGRVSSGRVHLVPRRSRPGLSLPARGTSYPSVYSLSCRVRCAQISTGYVMPRAFIWVRWVFERRFVHAPVHAPPPVSCGAGRRCHAVLLPQFLPRVHTAKPYGLCGASFGLSRPR